MIRNVRVLLVALLMTAAPVFALGADKLQDLLASAKPGQTVQVPEGTFAGPAVLPAGVSLKGAGYGKTIIDATGCDNGILVKGSEGAEISDLTVRGASAANVLVQGSQKVTVRRVRVTGGLVGASIVDGKGCRFENMISDANRYGIVLAGGEGNVAVNCTVTGNTSLGLSLGAGKNNVAFNNVVTDSPTAVSVGKQDGLVLDHNLYTGFNIGKYRGQLPRNTLNNWRYLTKLDAHSVNIPVKYEDAAQGKFKVVNVLDWALDRPVVTGWGTAKLSGHQAPTEDIDGVKRPAAPSLGAMECTAQAPRPADGTFTIPAGEGLSSAGVFDKNRMLVAYLFQCMPLTEGKYSFWLPSRTYKGRNIEAGEYEVRWIKANMDWKYMGWIANTETSKQHGASASAEIDGLAFDNDGRVMVGRRLSEEHMAVRCFDGATGKSLWWFDGDQVTGLTMASDGLLYALRPEQWRITRLKPATGDIAPWGEKDFGHSVSKSFPTCASVTSLGEELFFTDPNSNTIRVGTLKSPEPTRAIEIKAPTSPAADAKTNVIWVISEGTKVVALSPDGKVVAEYSDIPEPIAVAARDGRLAVASSKTGKVHLFDAANPAQIKAVRTLGRGDGPDGLILQDRFLFQDGAMEAKLAIGPKGELAVGEKNGRLLVFGADDKLQWFSYGIWGGGSLPWKATPGRLTQGRFTMLLDSEKGTWQLESFRRWPAGFSNAGDFIINGQHFLLMHVAKVGMNFFKYSPEKVHVVSGIVSEDPAKGPWTYRLDDNNDGVVDTKDKVVSTFTDAQGQPVVGKPFMASAHADGTLIGGGEGWLFKWPCAGLDEQGLPIYRYQDRQVLANDKADLISPYSLKSDVYGHHSLEPRDDGGLAGSTIFYSSPAVKHILAPGGCEMMGVNKDGVVDWVHPFGTYPGSPKIGAMHRAEDFYIAALTYSYDCFIVNADGLGMPGFSPPEENNFVGHWVDHPGNMNAWTDKQGHANVVTCDYMTSRNHWFRRGTKDVKKDTVKFTVTAETATALAALPLKPLDPTAGNPPETVLKIPKLKEPMKIDGDMQKWRDLGIATIILTPEASSGIDSAHDCSAIVRLAYRGKDLYLQVLRFDDILTLHQPQSRAYQGETVEMCLNGTMEGSKFNISLTSDLGPVNKVDGWFQPHYLLKQENSPLVIKVLDDAKTVTERKLIEDIYGIDMSDCKVQIFETRIPMDETTFKGREKYKVELVPGTPFRIGLMIDDNDKPGTDVQNCLVFPVTYGTFSPKDTAAIAVLEE